MNKNRILIDLSESDQTKFGKADFATHSVPQKVFSGIWALESEVNNGGFYPVFSQCGFRQNGSIRGIGAQRDRVLQAADICKRVLNSTFPAGVPATAAAVADAAAHFTEETLTTLRTLDAEFMAYPDDLTELLFAYVVKHPEECGEFPRPP